MNRQAETEFTLAPSIRRHLKLAGAFELVGGVGAPVGFVCYHRFATADFRPGPLEAIEFLALFLLGVMVPRMIFRFLVGAKCPAPDCRGRAFPKGANPVIYVCKSCKRSFPTEPPEQEDGCLTRPPDSTRSGPHKSTH